MTYHDTGPGEHLAETRCRVQGQRALEVVLGVEASVVVDARVDLCGSLERGSRCLNEGGRGRGRLRSRVKLESRHV